MTLPRFDCYFIVSLWAAGALLEGGAALAGPYPDLSKGALPAALDPRAGANVRLGDDPPALPATQRGQAEPHVFRCAANPDLLLATFQEGRYPAEGGAIDNGYSISTDGGLTWTRSLIPGITAASGGPYFRATDPVAAIGPQGDLYLASLVALDPNFVTSALAVSRSTDGGATWGAPAVVTASNTAQVLNDKEWLAVNDFAGTATTGRLVATWTNFTSDSRGNPTGNNLLGSTSDDRGATWSAPIAITPGGSDNQGTQPVFLPDGTLAVIYLSGFSATQDSIQCKFSADGGRTYPAAAVTIGLSTPWKDPVLRSGGDLPSAAVSRQTGRIFVAYTTVVNGTPRVLVASSSNRGLAWTAPVAASDNPAGDPVLNPAIAVTPDGSTVSVTFMDKRNAPDGINFIDVYAASSFDGGVTWQPSIRLSDESSDVRFAVETSEGRMLGDYMGLAPSLGANQPAVAIWCDTRTGDADPFIARFTPSPAANFAAWSVARFGRPELADPARTAASADFDGDGYPNFAKYALAADPRIPGAGNTLDVERSGALLTVACTLRTSSDVASHFESSPDGLAWQPLAPAGVSAPPSTAPLPAVYRQVASFALPAPGTFVRQVFGASPAAKFTTPEFFVTAGNGRIVNVSFRSPSGSGASVPITGFVVSGGTKTLLVRGVGPTLASYGVSGALADPVITLESSGATLASDDNWGSAASSPALAAAFARLGAFALPDGSPDAALLATVPAGPMTVLLTGRTSSPGVGLTEVYDADPQPGFPAGPRLSNVSARGAAGPGSSPLVAGFVIAGSQPRRILIRGIGPTLAAFGVPGSLADPTLALFQGSRLIAANDDWSLGRSPAAVAGAAQATGAFPLAASSLDSALLLTLPPGAYTAVVTSATGAGGIALVEAYDADP